MSATTQDLLEQILNLEEKIFVDRNKGKDVSLLELQLFELKERFHLMNETLKNNSNVLKG